MDPAAGLVVLVKTSGGAAVAGDGGECRRVGIGIGISPGDGEFPGVPIAMVWALRGQWGVSL